MLNTDIGRRKAADATVDSASDRDDGRFRPGGSVGRTYAILNLLAREPSLSLGELVQRLAIPQTTLGALLQDLQRVGMVTVLPDRPRRYAMGPSILHLTSRTLRRLDLRDVARPTMRKMSEELHAAAHLAVLSDRNDVVIYVAKLDAVERALNMASFVGMTAPVYSTALGKVLVAYSPDTRRANALAAIDIVPRTPKTVHSVEEFGGLLRQVQVDGHAFDYEENEPGISCCAAPVFDIHGACIAALSATLSTSQFQAMTAEVVAQHVERYAAEISSRLGFIRL